MRTLPNLGLDAFFVPGVDGWDDEVSLNFLKLSVLTQGGVIDKVAATPGAPAEGDVYLFDDTHATEPNAVAVYDDATWKYFEPQEGWMLYNRTADYFEKFDGAEWAELETGGSLPPGGTTGQALVKLSGADGDADWDDVAAGGGASGAEELIANLAIVGADGTFPAIDVTGFRSVRIVFNLKKGGADSDITGATFRFNGSAVDYYYKNLYEDLGAGGVSSDPQVNNAAQGSFALIASRSAGNTKLQSSGVVTFSGLDSATLNKGWVSHCQAYRSSSSGLFNMSIVGFWNVATVVTSIDIQESFAIGSTIQVVGIRADATPVSGPWSGVSGLVLSACAAVNATAGGLNPPFTGSHNVASVVRLAAGVYRINFITPEPDTNYLVTGSARYADFNGRATPSFALSRWTGTNGGLTGKQLDHVVVDLLDANAAGFDCFFDIVVQREAVGTGIVLGGVAFPVAPLTGQRFYRSDRKIEYTWDGTRWLSTQLHTLSFRDVILTASDNAYAPVPWQGIYSLWLERFETTNYVSDAAEWDVALRWVTGANVNTVLTTLDGAGQGAGTVVMRGADLDVALDAGARLLNVNILEVSGSATYIGSAVLHYRLIG